MSTHRSFADTPADRAESDSDAPDRQLTTATRNECSMQLRTSLEGGHRIAIEEALPDNGYPAALAHT